MITREPKKAATKAVATTNGNVTVPPRGETALALSKSPDKTPERINAEASHSSLFTNAGTSRELATRFVRTFSQGF